jgi:hypothetical protein
MNLVKGVAESRIIHTERLTVTTALSLRCKAALRILEKNISSTVWRLFIKIETSHSKPVDKKLAN